MGNEKIQTLNYCVSIIWDVLPATLLAQGLVTCKTVAWNEVGIPNGGGGRKEKKGGGQMGAIPFLGNVSLARQGDPLSYNST